MDNNAIHSYRVAKNTGFMFFRMLVTMGVGLFTSREILRILGVEDFGTYNLVGTIVVMFAFLQNALNNATSRYITFELGTGVLENLQRTFSMSINPEILLSVIVLVLSELVGPYFIETHLNIPEGRQMAAHVVYQLSLFNFVIGIIRTPFNALIIAHERMDYYAYTSIVEAILKLLVVYFLAVISYDKLIVFAFLLVGVSIIIFLWMYIYCKHHFEECKYSRVWDVKLFKKLTNYSGLSLLVNFCDVAVMQSITIFFNIFSGVVANAALGVANQVNTHLNNFLGNFSQSYSPQIIKSYATEEYDYFMKLIFSASKLRNRLLLMEKSFKTSDGNYYMSFTETGLYAYPKEWFSDYIMMPFENLQVRMPIGYHEYLTYMYGDYMQLPPEEKRNSLHSHYYYNTDEGLDIDEVKRRIKKGERFK